MPALVVGGIADQVVDSVHERHVADATIEEMLQIAQILFDSDPVLDAHRHGDEAGVVVFADVSGRYCRAEFVRMAGDESFDHVDEAVRVVSCPT